MKISNTKKLKLLADGNVMTQEQADDFIKELP